MTVRLRHLAEINPPVPGWDQIPDDQSLTFVPLEAVWPRRLDFTRTRPKSEASTGYTRFMEGDVIIPKITPTFEADRSTWVNGCPTRILTGTTELHVVRTGPRLDPRYLDYLFSSRPFLQDGASQMVGVAGQKRISDEWLRNYRIPVVDLMQQLTIANYLDTETSHIDDLISKKRRLIKLLQERWRAEVTNTIFGNISLPWVAIRHIVNLLPGFAFPSSDYTDEGIRLLRGVNIAPGHLRWDSDVVYLAAENRPHTSEYELTEGDVVLGMDRPVVGSGLRIALVAMSDLPCQLVQRVARIRGTKYADTQYIRFAMDSDAFIAYFSPIVTGVSVPHISADQILSFRVPLPSYDVQRTMATQLTQKRMMLTATCDRLSEQIDLLAERRQALITAVVTGEMQVPSPLT